MGCSVAEIEHVKIPYRLSDDVIKVNNNYRDKFTPLSNIHNGVLKIVTFFAIYSISGLATVFIMLRDYWRYSLKSGCFYAKYGVIAYICEKSTLV